MKSNSEGRRNDMGEIHAVVSFLSANQWVSVLLAAVIGTAGKKAFESNSERKHAPETVFNQGILATITDQATKIIRFERFVDDVREAAKLANCTKVVRALIARFDA